LLAFSADYDFFLSFFIYLFVFSLLTSIVMWNTSAMARAEPTGKLAVCLLPSFLPSLSFLGLIELLALQTRSATHKTRATAAN
jgi:hypothetical protein